jgi:hypothetical protein
MKIECDDNIDQVGIREDINGFSQKMMVER